jgi:DNA-binding MarR family transcriptional regulator
MLSNAPRKTVKTQQGGRPEPTDPVSLDLKLLVVLGRCTQSVTRRLFPHIRSAGLTHSQFEVLEILYHKGPLTVNEIIGKTLSSSGNIGVVVDNLVRLGWVQKRPDDTDRRIRYVELTQAGREKIGEYFPQHAREVQETFRALSREEKERLVELLKKLGRSIQEGL